MDSDKTMTEIDDKTMTEIDDIRTSMIRQRVQSMLMNGPDVSAVPDVLRAISAVSASLASAGGITKERKNEQQGYRFRGIDDVYNALAPLMAEHGLVVLPTMKDRTVVERATRNGGALFYVVVTAVYRFLSVRDGSEVVVQTYGEAMDSGDKATNKAMSAAYKYACLQTFCIPTEGDNDADAKTYEVAQAKPEEGKPKVRKGVKLTLDPNVEPFDFIEDAEICAGAVNSRALLEIWASRMAKSKFVGSDREAMQTLYRELAVKYLEDKS